MAKTVDELVKSLNERLIRWLALNAQRVEYGPTEWIDYSNASTITGWSALTAQQIFYQKRGNIVKGFFYISGTSDAVSVSFTMPYTASADITYHVSACRGADNGANITNACLVQVVYGTKDVVIYSDMAGGAWTNAGTKMVAGQFEYKVDENG